MSPEGAISIGILRKQQHFSDAGFYKKASVLGVFLRHQWTEVLRV